MDLVANKISDLGLKTMRAGCFKPRTSPYEFQGLGEKGLEILANAAQKYNLDVITEVLSIDQIDLVSAYSNILQVGARNMQNFPLLKRLGQQVKPVFLKRSASATYHEFLMAAEYILSEGNKSVMLCERGIRTFETQTRNTLDLSILPILSEKTNLPIYIDPSHAVGVRSAVPALARAAVAAGADGLMIEVHPEPDKSISDAKQAISLDDLARLLPDLISIASIFGRKIV